MSAERLSRRAVLAGAGALVVSFSLLPRDLLAQGSGEPKLPRASQNRRCSTPGSA